MTEVWSWTVIGVVVLAVIVVILARFYVRASRETSLVKTGVGGRKVVMDGGVVAIPYFHEVARVNMQTLRLEVTRSGEAALITKDRLRVDVGVVFYVAVIPTKDGVARAAQTLGNRTFHAEQLRELIEGKLIDALRAVAARLTMDELHENRGTFVSDVRESLATSLARNGLELDSVSLTALDQTPFKALDENNAFNAVGLRKLAEVIAKSRKERAEIDADADVSVRRAAMEAAKRKLEIDLEEQEAEIAQVQQIETLKARQMAEVVKRKTDSERESAQARITMERDIRAAEIAKDVEIQAAEISRERDLEIANQERQIAIDRKSQEESQARSDADTKKALAAAAEESIGTAREVAQAERRREVARAEAETTEIRVAATQKESAARAAGQRAAIEAENAMDPKIVAMKTELARLEALPKVVEQIVKPAEKIDSIRIHQISGLHGGHAGDGKGSADKPAVNRIVDSIMDMAVQLPALKKIGEELGISLEEELEGLKGKGAAGRKAGAEKSENGEA